MFRCWAATHRGTTIAPVAGPDGRTVQLYRARLRSKLASFIEGGVVKFFRQVALNECCGDCW